MSCPVCKSTRFYIKDPGDAFETYEFECRQGGVHFSDPGDSVHPPEIKEDSEIFCQRCSWHGNKSKVQ